MSALGQSTSRLVSGLDGVKVGSAAALTASACIECAATNRAILLPRLTTTQRDALTAAAGMHVYNTTLLRPQWHNGTTWSSAILSGATPVVLGEATLVSAAASMSVTIDHTGYDHMAVQIHLPNGCAAVTTPQLRFNGDSGANYAHRRSANYAAPSATPSTTGILLYRTSSNLPFSGLVDLYRPITAGSSASVNSTGTLFGAALPGIATAPDIVSTWGVWGSSAMITSVTLDGNGANLGIGAHLSVMGLS